jgi:tRNA uridine 5-carbamoylmethylation protein Kti12
MCKNTIIINLFGGPGCGKSTAAAQIYSNLKVAGVEVELVTEYAKDMTWEKRFNILDEQIYVFAKQCRKISRLIGEVDVVVVDSPLLMCITYMRDGYFSALAPLIEQVWNSHNNFSVMVDRKTVYSQIGRSQTEQESIDKDAQIIRLLNDYNVQYELHDVVNGMDVLMSSIAVKL